VKISEVRSTTVRIPRSPSVQEIDLFWQMLEEPLRPVGGHASAPTRPGLGVTLDRAAVGRRAVSVETTTG
jgi:L-alanine-DL-glutamate epimerase-like enolase superfamily enzyme